MSVFLGGRTLEAIESVCNAVGDLDLDILDGAESLISKSLLRPEDSAGGEPRFVMLETIHEYARAKLEESGEAQALEREHALYFMKLAEEAEPHLTSTQQQEWLDRLEDEHDNLRTALAWAREHAEKGDPGAAEIGLRTGGAIWRFWVVRGHYGEGRGELEAMLSWGASSGDTADGTQSSIPNNLRKTRARALHGAGALAIKQGDIAAAKSLLDGGLPIYRELGDKAGIAYLLSDLGDIPSLYGDLSGASSIYEEALAIFRELGDRRGIAQTLYDLGWLTLSRGDLINARDLFEESLAIEQERGNKRGISLSLNGLANMASQQGNYARARTLFEESLAISKELGDKAGVAIKLGNLGMVDVLEGKLASARLSFEEGLAIFRESMHARWVAWLLSSLGNVGILEGDYASARLFYEESLQIARKLGS